MKKDTKTLNVNIDIKNAKILDENFDELLKEHVNNMIMKRYDLKLNFIDNNIVSDEFNWAVNKYVSLVTKNEGSFANKNYLSLIPRFSKGLCNIFNRNNVGNYFDKVIIEIFYMCENAIGKYFRAYLPEGIISQERYNNLMVLGPDNLAGEFSLDVEVDYIFPALFCFLYEYEEQDNDKYLDYGMFQFGLA